MLFRVTALHDDRKLLAENPNIEMPEYELDSVRYTEKFPSPRYIKTHLPFSLLPEKLQCNEEAKVRTENFYMKAHRR